jgi:hypothetical protein
MFAYISFGGEAVVEPNHTTAKKSWYTSRYCSIDEAEMLVSQRRKRDEGSEKHIGSKRPEGVIEKRRRE